MSRIARALNSSDLSHQHLDREAGTVDVDVVRSLALTGIYRNLGVLVIEARESCAGENPHDAARIRDLVEAVRRAVESQAARDQITVRHKATAEFMVKELILDCCPRCQGRGFLPLAYGPDSRDDERGADCPTCFASGRARRDFQGRARAAGHGDYNAPLKRFWEAVESRIVDAESTARRANNYRLARN